MDHQQNLTVTSLLCPQLRSPPVRCDAARGRDPLPHKKHAPNSRSDRDVCRFWAAVAERRADTAFSHVVATDVRRWTRNSADAYAFGHLLPPARRGRACHSATSATKKTFQCESCQLLLENFPAALVITSVVGRWWDGSRCEPSRRVKRRATESVKTRVTSQSFPPALRGRSSRSARAAISNGNDRASV